MNLGPQRIPVYLTRLQWWLFAALLVVLGMLLGVPVGRML